MPEVPWDTIFTEGHEWQSPDVYAPFYKAVNERLLALADPLDIRPDGLYDLSQVPGKDAIYAATRFSSGIPTGAYGYGWLQRIVDGMGDAYLDPLVTLAGRPADFGPNGDDHRPLYVYLKDRPAWPGPNGWTRKYERCISTLAAPGTDGERARFLYAAPNPSFPAFSAFPDPAAAEPYGSTLPPTPVAEKQYSTKIMVRESGAWVVAADQAAPPDVVTAYGLAREGDLFGPWILNELRDAINDLTHTVPDHGGGFAARFGTAEHFGEYDNSPPAVTFAAVESALPFNLPPLADVDGNGQPTGPAATFYMSRRQYSSHFGAFRYYATIGKAENRPHATSVHNPPGLDGSTPMARELSLWVAAVVPTWPVSGPVIEFEPFSTGLANMLFTLNHVETTTAPALAGQIIGDVSTVPTPRPTLSTPEPQEDPGRVLGYVPAYIEVTARWDVPGGFTYTA